MESADDLGHDAALLQALIDLLDVEDHTALEAACSAADAAVAVAVQARALAAQVCRLLSCSAGWLPHLTPLAAASTAVTAAQIAQLQPRLQALTQ